MRTIFGTSAVLIVNFNQQWFIRAARNEKKGRPRNREYCGQEALFLGLMTYTSGDPNFTLGRRIYGIGQA